MTPEFRKQAHMLAAMFAMNGLLQRGMREDEVVDVAHKVAEDLVSKYDEGIVALKKRGKK